ncbi:MAG: hypothetical protein P8181_09410 [bacterium]
MVGAYQETVRLLGERTAEMHLALASNHDNPAFAPETLSALSQRAMYQSMRTLTVTTFQTLRKFARRQPKDIRREVQEIIERQGEVLERFKIFKERRISTTITRRHGDYHLGQVLYTGKDFVIIDFEGEPARTLNERRRKHSPLTDVAGMIRSFSYAAHSALMKHAAMRPSDTETLRPWMGVWESDMSAAFLRSYLETAGDAPFIPEDREALGILLEVFLLEKAVYELGYEINNRPGWVGIPLKGIRRILDAS